MEQKKYELEDRFTDLISGVLGIVDALPDSSSGNYLGEKLVKTVFATSSRYNNDVQKARSRTEFIQQMWEVLKELKESRTILKIISVREMVKPASKLEKISDETEHLIAIIGKSISTAKKNKTKTAAA